jgi:hypothetical protein
VHVDQGGGEDMDPFVATIVKQSALILGAFAVAGVIIAAIYGLNQYGKLQYAMTLNMAPPQIP